MINLYLLDIIHQDFRGKKNGHMEIDFKNMLPQIISAQPDPREDERRK